MELAMYSSIIEKALHEINTRFGENLTALVLDGKIQRGGKKDHVWYVGNEWTYNGQIYQSVKYGSWKQAGEYLVKSWDSEIESNKNWRKKYQDHTREAKAALDLTRQEKQEKCRLKWTPIFNNAEKGKPDHEYLKLKGITELYTAKNPSGNILLVPAYNAVKGMVGVQRIFKDQDPESETNGQWVKRFSSGIEIKGAFCPLKPFRNSEYCYVAEGFATAASIQLAFPDIPAICVFNAGNILPAIEHIRAINPKIKIMIAADKDQPDKKGEKAGEKYAILASASVLLNLKLTIHHGQTSMTFISLNPSIVSKSSLQSILLSSPKSCASDIKAINTFTPQLKTLRSLLCRLILTPKATSRVLSISRTGTRILECKMRMVITLESSGWRQNLLLRPAVALLASSILKRCVEEGSGSIAAELS
mgnify:CR=1 FL=1